MTFLDNYEDVNSRIKRFRAEFPSGRLIAFVEDANLKEGWILIKAEAYREYEDHLPSAVDYAYGNVATYPANLKKWFVEDTITSAYGRCIGLLTPSLEHKARSTSQDMARVEQPISTPDYWSIGKETEGSAVPLAATMETVAEQLGGEVIESSPICNHGRMIYKEGKSSKTGNAYKGWTCPSKLKTDQCKAVWM
jgi:hypothetical protein